MRLFIGISIGPTVLDKLGQALDELRPLARLNWSPAENLHITTKFIGDWPEARLTELQAALEAVETAGKLEIGVSGFGFYPNERHPRVLFAGVHSGSGLAQLAHNTEASLAPLGCAVEDRAYAPHLTLARLQNEDVRNLRQHTAAMINPDFGKFEAADFHLYLSKPGRGGSTYTKLATYPLLSKETATAL